MHSVVHVRHRLPVGLCRQEPMHAPRHSRAHGLLSVGNDCGTIPALAAAVPSPYRDGR